MQIHIGVILGEFSEGTIYKGLGSISDLKRRNSRDIWILWLPQAQQAERSKSLARRVGTWRPRGCMKISCLTRSCGLGPVCRRLQEGAGGINVLPLPFLPPSSSLLWLPLVTPKQKPECRQPTGHVECVCGALQGLGLLRPKSKGLVFVRARAMVPQGISPASQSRADMANTAREANE